METKETKSKLLTIRVTSLEYDRIKTTASQQNQSISQYAADRILSGNGMTLAQKRMIYQQLLKIQDAAMQLDDNEKSEKITEECEQIWQFLKL